MYRFYRFTFYSLLLVLFITSIYRVQTSHKLSFFDTPQKEAQQVLSEVVTVEEKEYEEEEEAFSSTEQVVEIVRRATPHVVAIVDTSMYRRGGEAALNSSVGTGFLVEGGEVVVTSKHVLNNNGGQYAILFPDGEEVRPAEIVSDTYNDLAFMKIEEPRAGGLSFGDSSMLAVGQQVVAIGNAFGRYTNTVTTGVVSGIGRGVSTDGSNSTVETLENVIQTDAALNPGNSGGPLLDMDGLVIGVASAISEEGENIGFATPIDVAKHAVQSYMNDGKLERPFLGVRYTRLTEAVSSIGTAGVRVDEVIEGSAAQAAGLHVGDIITAFAGETLGKGVFLRSLVARHQVGETVTVTIDRLGEELTVSLTLTSVPVE